MTNCYGLEAQKKVIKEDTIGQHDNPQGKRKNKDRMGEIGGKGEQSLIF